MGIPLGRQLWRPWGCTAQLPLQKTWVRAGLADNLHTYSFGSAGMFTSRPHWLLPTSYWLPELVGVCPAPDSSKGQPVLRGSPPTRGTLHCHLRLFLRGHPPASLLTQVLDLRHGVTISCLFRCLSPTPLPSASSKKSSQHLVLPWILLLRQLEMGQHLN